jgi:hypothetical protein
MQRVNLPLFRGLRGHYVRCRNLRLHTMDLRLALAFVIINPQCYPAGDSPERAQCIRCWPGLCIIIVCVGLPHYDVLASLDMEVTWP